MDLVYNGLGAIVAMDRRFNVNQWQIEEYRADPLGHVWWSQTKSFADGPQLEQRGQLRLQTGALMSRAAAFPQSPTASTLYPDEVTTGIPTSGIVARTGEVQRNLSSGDYTHYAATRTYSTVDGKTHVVQRYQVNSTISNGAYEEYRYDALGRRVLMRTRKTTTPPAGGGLLAALCGTGPCASSISRWIWDGAQLLGEIRAPGHDGLNSGQLDQLFGSPPHYGVVGYVHHHAGGWDEPKALMDGRVFNPNWRGLPESSQLVDGSAPDCSMGLNPGSCITVAWPTDVGPYFRRPVPAAQGSIVPTWLGSLAANGQTGSGRLHRRFREYDPATGQFTQEDPIGLVGGLNLYGFANGDPVNF
ncbi:MAG: RHS repeat-associated core domain-containing protein, partial [Gemmatimonadaceae bacterium]